MLREEASQGKDAGVEIRLCESLINRDEEQFREGMQEFLDRRLGEIERNEDVKLGEEYLSIEGLGLRRLAARVGLDVTIDHRLTPADLQRDYPPTDTLSRGDVPVVGPEIEEPRFWDGWSPVESW